MPTREYTHYASSSHDSHDAISPQSLAALTAVIEASGSSIPAAEMSEMITSALVSGYRRYVSDDLEIGARITPLGGIELYRNGTDGITIISAPGEVVMREAARIVRGAIEERRLLVNADHLSSLILNNKGMMYDGVLDGSDDGTWILSTKDFHAILPPHEQIPGEVLMNQDHIRVVIVSAKRVGGSIVAIVSRSHPLLVRRLLEQEVPEIVNEQIVIDAIAREAGRRSKVAVHALDTDIDAQGACIGPKGMRHRSIVQQLGGEHVHIVTWSSDMALYIANALAPATVTSVSLNEELHTATVDVPASQLSLAIGKGGENARLVAKLTGWKIDIQSDQQVPTEQES